MPLKVAVNLVKSLEQPNLKNLLAKVNRLKSLLDDPHPGVLTWRQAYCAAALDVAGVFLDKDE
jgi:hypothetical protein